MTFREAFGNRPLFLMEGALGERLKREHGLAFDDQIVVAQ